MNSEGTLPCKSIKKGSKQNDKNWWLKFSVSQKLLPRCFQGTFTFEMRGNWSKQITLRKTWPKSPGGDWWRLSMKFLPVMMSWIELSTDGIFPSLNKLALIYLSILNKDVLFIVRHMGEVFPSFDKLALIYLSILNKDVLFIVRHKVW